MRHIVVAPDYQVANLIVILVVRSPYLRPSARFADSYDFAYNLQKYKCICLSSLTASL